MAYEKTAQQKETVTRSLQQQKPQGGALNMIDNRPEAAAQRKIQSIMQGGTQTAQRAPEEEEEMMQGKFEIQRAPEEEEMPQV